MTLQNDRVQTASMMSSLKKAEEGLMDKRNKLERLKCEKASLAVEHVSLQKTYDSMLSQKEKMILKKRDLEELLTGTDEAKLEEVTSEYDSIAVKLKNLENSLDAVCQDVNTEDEHLSLLTRKLDQTYTRLGRGQQFTSRDERDEWIQKELETIRAQIEKKNLQLNELETFSGNTKLNLREKEAEIKVGKRI